LNDITVDLFFDGDEYHSATYSLTSYALAVSNLTDGISMFTGLEDADNDGTNNITDLDNAGDFMPILVKTHESATNTFFRFDFDETKIKVWTEDSNAMTTRTNSYIPNGNLIQAYHNYSYSDLLSEGAERELYVQALVSGEHEIDVTYVLDGQELWTESLSVTFAKIDIAINGLDEEDEISIGAFVPINADNDNGSIVSNFIAACRDFDATNYFDDDLVELTIDHGNDNLEGQLKLSKTENGRDQIKLWTTTQKQNEVALPITWNYETDTIPESLYIEGIK